MPRTKTINQDQGEKTENPYLPRPTKITLVRRESPDCFLIRTDLKSKYEPGQFFQVSIPGIGEAPISVASYSQDFLDLNIREVGNVTKYLSKLKKGDTLFIRGPYGKGYPMEKLFGKSLMLIGGGSGVAPLKGILTYVDQHKDSFGDVTIYFGFRTPDDILFKEEMKQWRRKYQLNMSVDKNPKKAKISCDVCFITNLVEKAKLNPENKVVFICGPPVMMKITIELLKNKGFKEDQIYISTERLMKCALGVCGHCMIHGKYTCLDGPVFRYDEISQDRND
ncbi:FAD/NAD(P)-binding protein [Candidatus Woesearchaeota archaeon]|nr:FAD/NAD(P)-binding protein [Candidatus Woesearchaeota archaeon]